MEKSSDTGLGNSFATSNGTPWSTIVFVNIALAFRRFIDVWVIKPNDWKAIFDPYMALERRDLAPMLIPRGFQIAFLLGFRSILSMCLGSLWSLKGQSLRGFLRL